jgi:hypothetical protein
MRQISLGIAAAASLFASGAVAADLPLKAPPPPVVVYSWTGFYIGGRIESELVDQARISLYGSRPVRKRDRDRDQGHQRIEHAAGGLQHSDHNNYDGGLQHPLYRQHSPRRGELSLRRPGGCKVLIRPESQQSKAPASSGAFLLPVIAALSPERNGETSLSLLEIPHPKSCTPRSLECAKLPSSELESAA